MIAPPGSPDRERKLFQTARMMWVMFPCAACAIIACAYRIGTPHPEHIPAPSLSWTFAAIAAVDFVVFGILRRSLLARSQEQSTRGEPVAAQATWLKAQMLGFAGGMSIVLFGFVLHLMGARPAWISIIFFVAGLLNLVAYRPQLTQARR